MLPLPRTEAEHAAQDARMAGIVLGHPIRSNFPKPVVEALVHVADGDHDLADADVSRLALAALAVAVDAEIVACREMRT